MVALLQIMINQVLELTTEERKKMGSSGRNAVLDHFSYEKLASQFAELL